MILNQEGIGRKLKQERRRRKLEQDWGRLENGGPVLLRQKSFRLPSEGEAAWVTLHVSQAATIIRFICKHRYWDLDVVVLVRQFYLTALCASRTISFSFST